MALNLLSLCSGIGGAELGLQLAGLHHLINVGQFVEKDEFCQRVLAKNFPGRPIHDDIHSINLEPGEFGLLSAGFPCQPHSQAGSQKASKDKRDLWPEVYRIICDGEPQGVLLENVPGLRTSEKGAFFKKVVGNLADAGYAVEWGHTTAASVGAVHRRRRVWILAYPSSSRRFTPWSAIATKEGAIRTPDSASAAQLATRTQTKSAVCDSNDGLPTRLAGSLMTFDNLNEWLPFATDGEDKPLRKAQLTALGNAICPHQIAPVWLRLAERLYLL